MEPNLQPSAAQLAALKGRGAGGNPANRFDPRRFELAEWEAIDELPEMGHNTQFIPVQAKSILNQVDSPDIGPALSMNAYQGCEHGCIYCYARPTHEYWGYSAGLDFEQRILYKPDAPRLLEEAFRKQGHVPQTIMLSGNTDCYQPAERKFQLTRQLLEVCARYRHPVGIVTKNALVLRDVDLLQELARFNAVRVYLSLTTLDEDLRRVLEPRTSTTRNRLKTIEALTQAGITTGAMFAPLIPGLNDHELPQLMQAAAEAGAQTCGYTVVRLNGALGPMFEDWIRTHRPNLAEKVLRRIREAHGGQLSDSRFHTRMRGEGTRIDALSRMYSLMHQRYFAHHNPPAVNTAAFCVPDKGRTQGLFAE